MFTVSRNRIQWIHSLYMQASIPVYNIVKIKLFCGTSRPDT